MAVSIKLLECTTGNCSAPSVCNLMSDIDRKLHKNAKIELDRIRFYLDNPKCYKSDFEELRYYQTILCRKLANDDCLCEFSLEDITSQIKRLLNN